MDHNTTQHIHYSWRLGVMTLKSEGTADCGKSGIITAYPGLVTCPYCLILVEADKKVIENNVMRKQISQL